MKKILSMSFVLIIILLSVLPTYALDNSLVKNKLDNGLELKLNDIDKDERVHVSIWFSDVDKEQVKDKLYEKCKATKNADIYTKTEKLLFGEVCDIPVGYKGDYLSYAKEYYSDITQEDFQYISNKKREVFRNEYQTHNQKNLNKIKDILEDDNIKVTFISKYAPNIEVELTKEDISKVCGLDIVEDICLVSEDTELLTNETSIISDLNDDSDYDDTFFEVTGLLESRERFSGSGMKVGVIEIGSILDKNRINPDNITIVRDGTSNKDHGNTVVGIMVADTEEFVGAIPDAHLFYASANSENEVKEVAELLLDEGVIAINCSFGFPSIYIESCFNTYGDTAKWYDHIAVQHNVHLILASDNEGDIGVPYTNTSYNAIVVGNCNNQGLIEEGSSYVTGTNLMYKPDIVAPGNPVTTPFGGGIGTSYSAPMVTSAVIQLAQASTILASNPTLMKSLLLSSSTITSSMQNEPMYSTVGTNAIALSRQYGAGMLNVTKAYETFVAKENFISNSFSNYSTGAFFNRSITNVANKTIRFCLTWEKHNTVSGNHATNVTNSPSLDNLRLTVVTPNNEVYHSNYLYDNKQIITFNATEEGYYAIRIYREGTANSNSAIDYSITYTVY